MALCPENSNGTLLTLFDPTITKKNVLTMCLVCFCLDVFILLHLPGYVIKGATSSPEQISLPRVAGRIGEFQRTCYSLKIVQMHHLFLSCLSPRKL